MRQAKQVCEVTFSLRGRSKPDLNPTFHRIDKALKMALDLLHGQVVNPSLPPERDR